VKRALIVGGGSGGTILANSLDRHEFEITMLSSSFGHLFQPALLYVAFSHARARVVRDERSLLARHVNLLHDEVTSINLKKKTVTTRNGVLFPYDYLVVATGMHTDTSQIPGLSEINAEFGDYHSSLAKAERLSYHLDGFRGGTIAIGQSSPIIKCPPSPLEGVLLTDQLLRKRGLRKSSRLVYFTPYPRPYSAEPMNEVVEPLLEERDIEVMTFFDVKRIDPINRTIFSIEGDKIEYDLPIIIPPFVGANILYEPADAVDEDHFIIADKSTLRIKGTGDAFVVGDASNLPTSKAGVGAHLQAKVVAKILSGHPATFDGRTSCPFDTGDGRGTFVIGSYEAPVTKARPTRIKHLMKTAFQRIYWISLRGTLNPAFDVYFKLTAPKKAAATGN
jgi:sulfide:quinone oxidoreductase